MTLIEENNDKMGRGTTGLVTWQGSLALTQWAVEFFPWFVGGAKVSRLTPLLDWIEAPGSVTSVQ